MFFTYWFQLFEAYLEVHSHPISSPMSSLNLRIAANLAGFLLASAIYDALEVSKCWSSYTISLYVLR